MKYMILIIALALTGCGSDKAPNTIDSAFQPLYSQFIGDANANGLALPVNQGLIISFSTLEQPNGDFGYVIGECSALSYGNSTIKIDQNFWNATDLEGQTILLYHELGHCVLAEGHTTDQESIMYPIINMPELYYPADWSDMLVKLFVNKGNKGTSDTTLKERI